MKQIKSRKLPEAKPLFLERMKELFGSEKDFKDYLEILKKPPVKSIRCNKLKISPKELKKKLEAKGWKIKQPFREYPEIMVVEGKAIDNKNHEQANWNKDVKKSLDINSDIKFSEQKRVSNLIELEPGELGRALEHLIGYYYIQELASMLPVIALKPKPNEIILDLCASPGSKTTQLASEMKNTGVIIANEVSLGRIKILASNLERCGVANTIITKKDGISLCKRIKKYNPELRFDKILVDAPCSGEGTLRSSPKTYLMWNINTIRQLSGIQKKLLESALKILKPNGELVYSTCTHAPEENEGVLNYVLNSEEFKDKIKIEKIPLPKELNFRQGIKKWQDKEYIEDVKYSCRIYPQDSDTEGFFIAKIKKLKWKLKN